MLLEELQKRYILVLKNYFEHKHEKYLFQAAELGRDLVREEIPIEDIAELHEHATHLLGAEIPDAKLRETVQRISVPLMEMLMSYGLAFRELLEKRKQAEEAIRIERDNLKNIFKAMEDGVYIANKDYDIQYVNPALIKDFGSYEGSKCYTYFHDREDVCPWCKNSDVFAGKTVRWEWSSSKSGKVYDLIDTPLKNPDGSISKVEIFRDITLRKKAEVALRESEEKFRVLYNSSPDMYISVSPDNASILMCNDTLLKKTGYSREEVIGTPIFKMYHDDCMAEVKKTFQQFVETGIVKDKELILKRKDGSKINVSLNDTAVRDEANKIIQSVSNWRDITERKQVEADRERLNTAIEQSTETILVTDTQGKIQYINPAFTKLSGYSKEEALGQNPRILKSGKQNQSFYKELWDSISGGKVWQGRLINRKKDGRLYTEDATISPVFSSTGKIINYVAIKRDITKEEELEKQFLQAQKMDSVGRLAGGVAHDFNNMLAVIIGYSELALAKLNPEDELFKDIREINKAGQRSADLTRQLLAFSRKQTIAPQVAHLNDVIENMLKMLRRLIGEDINLIWSPQTNLGNVYIDTAQIDQILANLCVNARDAIGGNGKVTIETNNVSIDKAYYQAHSFAKPGDYILLTVSDNGCGMDDETKANIFEPFFTTKPLGEGTGLGLATIYGIVKQNKGFINVYSEPGQGTSFKIYLPCYEGTDVAEVGESEKKLPVGHGELILLVEDEAAILELAQSMLESIGYAVLVANSPQEALHVAKNQSEKIMLLLTDVVMPEMNGRELANQLKPFHPRIKVLFMSGYTSKIIEHRGVLEDNVNFINKPFSIHQLAEKLYKVFQQ